MGRSSGSRPIGSAPARSPARDGRGRIAPRGCRLRVGGTKRIRVTGLGGCHGGVTREITVGHDSQQRPVTLWREFDASGDPSGTTPADFPFPAHRAYSRVCEGGTRRIQGEAGPVVFGVTETAPPEICVDDKAGGLFHTRGVTGIDIDVNERSATA